MTGGTQYTSELYRKSIYRYGIVQSMNSAGGRCHDNARCESMWARFKEELLYGRYDPTSMTVEQLKTLIWSTSSATGIIGGSAPLMVDYLQWLSDNNTMLRYRRQHKGPTFLKKCKPILTISIDRKSGFNLSIIAWSFKSDNLEFTSYVAYTRNANGIHSLRFNCFSRLSISSAYPIFT